MATGKTEEILASVYVYAQVAQFQTSTARRDRRYWISEISQYYAIN
jgi:hypothetical protein